MNLLLYPNHIVYKKKIVHIIKVTQYNYYFILTYFPLIFFYTLKILLIKWLNREKYVKIKNIKK